ncbi:MAG TPA: hypothetical protein VMU39_05345 [Solirubrobacteraceae bacterium]|nr:hypothetical protein [Solirubrobacteraceae bacterium]
MEAFWKRLSAQVSIAAPAIGLKYRDRSRQLKQRAVRADYALKEPLSRPDETLARRWNVRSADGLDARSRAINKDSNSEPRCQTASRADETDVALWHCDRDPSRNDGWPGDAAERGIPSREKIESRVAGVCSRWRIQSWIEKFDCQVDRRHPYGRK